MSSDRISLARAAVSYSSRHNARSRSATSSRRHNEAICSRVSALLLSTGTFGRSRPAVGSVASQARCRQKPHAERRIGGYLVGLAAVREAAGLTKKELAQRAGLSRETVSRIETLKRPAEPATVRALAAALEVEPVVLVTS